MLNVYGLILPRDRIGMSDCKSLTPSPLLDLLTFEYFLSDISGSSFKRSLGTSSVHIIYEFSRNFKGDVTVAIELHNENLPPDHQKGFGMV